MKIFYVLQLGYMTELQRQLIGFDIFSWQNLVKFYNCPFLKHSSYFSFIYL